MSSNSSTHRPAVKVTMATPTRVRSLLQKASDLELRLEATTTGSHNNNNNNNNAQMVVNEKEKQRLRSQLCETLSDIILTDPQYAMSKDCCGRLWRCCFYSEIGTFRQLIHREKRKQGPARAAYERAQAKFLQEAIQLYNFLIANYQERLQVPGSFILSPPSQSQPTVDGMSQDDSQATTGVAAEATAASAAQPTAGIVEGLHRLLIHLGDLHRYAESFNKAEACYIKAAKLAPGKGNPYNQLAVVAQLKDPASPLNCVALYWYARSLLATEEPFTTSQNNLRRLLESNRQLLHKMNHNSNNNAQLHQYHKKAGKHTPPTPKTSGGGGVAAAAGASKKALLEASRAQKAAASKLFLLQFVDLHFDFFSGLPANQDDPNIHEMRLDASKCHSILTKMERLMESFRSALQSSAFGDALLCKMVTINAFSVTWPNRGILYHPATTEQTSHHPSELTTDKIIVMSMAHAFLLAFGFVLAERLEQTLGKVLDSGTQQQDRSNEGIPSVRLLMPLLLTLDFITTLPSQHHPTTLLRSMTAGSMENGSDLVMSIRDITIRWFASLLEKLARVANLLAPLETRRVRVSGCSSSGSGAGGMKGYHQLQEMKHLRGFAPFQRFILASHHDSQPQEEDDGFVSAADATEALELGTSSGVKTALSSSSTQESVASAGSASTNATTNIFSPEENKCKIHHFLEVLDEMVTLVGPGPKSGSLFPTKLTRDKQGVYHVVASSSSSQTSAEVGEVLPATEVDEPRLHHHSPSNDIHRGVSSKGDDDVMDTTMDENQDDDDVAIHLDDEDEDADKINGRLPLTVQPEAGGASGGDVLVYKAPEGGQGPALLVPGDLLLNLVNDGTTTNEKIMEPIEHRNEPMNIAEPVALSSYFDQLVGPVTTGVVPTNKALSPPSPHRVLPPVAMDIVDEPSLVRVTAATPAAAAVALSPPRPPPGFGGMSNGSTAPVMPSRVNMIATETTGPSAEFFGPQQPQYQQPPQPTPMGIPFHWQPSYSNNYVGGGPTVGESFPFFGSGFPAQPPATVNPFMSPIPMGFQPAHDRGGLSFPGPSFGVTSMAAMTSMMPPHFLDSETTPGSASGADDTTLLLDSSLLSSLWMDDSNNNNNSNDNNRNNNNGRVDNASSDNHHHHHHHALHSSSSSSNNDNTTKQRNPFAAT